MEPPDQPEDPNGFHTSKAEEDLEPGFVDEVTDPDIEMKEVEPNTRPELSERLFKAYMAPFHKEPKVYGKWGSLVLAYQTLGVVYGDLGTSPLYVYSSISLGPNFGTKDLLGILSLIFWTLTMVGLVKYVFIVLRANDHGEGGTFALYSLLCQHAKVGQNAGEQYRTHESDASLSFYSRSRESKTRKLLERTKWMQKALLVLVMLGTCMVIGDGVLTPAISVLSAIVGIRSADPSFGQSKVILVSVIILVTLFLLQRFGTHKVSFMFSPVMVVWFVSTPIIGVYNIAKYYPGVFKALSPHYIVDFFMRNKTNGWIMLDGVVLAITGAEAMFCDLSHFNMGSIQLAFSGLVYPSLILTYAGQTAYLIKNPQDIGDAFFKSIPHTVYWPMFVVATLAAIVASQALISATFSIIKQSMALGCFPRVKMIHTSEDQEGQIYSPEINYLLMVLCIIIVVGFRNGTQIGNAFGVAVIFVMLITTMLLTLVMLIVWRLPWPVAFLFLGVFGLIEGVYMTAVLNKVPQGGWVPFAIAGVFLIVSLSWNYGRQKKSQYEMINKVSSERLGELLSSSAIQRVPGMCFFYSDLFNGVPPIITHYVRNVRTLHEVLVFTTIRYVPVKTVLPEERFLVGRMGFKGVYRCVARYGYMDIINAEGNEFMTEAIHNLKNYLQSEDQYNLTYAQRTALQSSNGLVVAEQTNQMSDWDNSNAEDLAELEDATRYEAVYVLGKTKLRSTTRTNWLEQIVVNRIYRFLKMICRPAIQTLRIPPANYLEVGMLYET